MRLAKTRKKRIAHRKQQGTRFGFYQAEIGHCANAATASLGRQSTIVSIIWSSLARFLSNCIKKRKYVSIKCSTFVQGSHYFVTKTDKVSWCYACNFTQQKVQCTFLVCS
jgi:hypothetical protein